VEFTSRLSDRVHEVVKTGEPPEQPPSPELDEPGDMECRGALTSPRAKARSRRFRVRAARRSAATGGRYNPEEVLVSALANCQMLWVLHLSPDAGILVTENADEAWGEMGGTPQWLRRNDVGGAAASHANR